MRTFYNSYDNVKFKFLPTSKNLEPLYLKTNRSPLEAVVVSVGAVSSLNSYAALNDTVLEPVPSCIINRDTNCPVCAFVPAPNVLLAPSVTFATGLVPTSQDIVEASVNVASGCNAALVKDVKPTPEPSSNFY